jgi:hypothetical protein
MNQILDQLARTTLLPDDLSSQILSGGAPPLEEIALSLVIGAIDAQVMIANDPASSWNDKRLARLGLGVAFLAAICTLRGPSEETAVARQSEISL